MEPVSIMLNEISQKVTCCMVSPVRQIQNTNKLNKREMIGNRTVDLWGREWGFAMPGRGKDEERKGKN